MTTQSRFDRFAPAAVGVIFATSGLLFAGPLTPPPGAIVGTHKTLTEVEPRIAINATNTPGNATALFRITQPGSYYLAGNVTGVAGRHGIEIVASGVTLDLNGFDLIGVAGSLDGVFASTAGMVNITVKNGSARGWGGYGVNLFNFGNNTLIADVTANNNGSVGIGGGFGGIVSRCASYANVGNGIQAGTVSTVTECSSYTNQASGITVAAGSIVSNCSTRFNGLDGIVAFRGCLIKDNTCASNGNVGSGAGIHVTDVDNRIEGNNCTQADRGIDVDAAGNIIVRNTCSGNTTNWDIVAGNTYGPIVAAGTNAAATVGNGGFSSTLGSTDPHANFSY